MSLDSPPAAPLLTSSRVVAGFLVWGAMVVGYTAALSTESGSRLATDIADYVRNAGEQSLAPVFYAAALMGCLLTPFSPATILVLVAVTIWGPVQAFGLSFAAAMAAAGAAYGVGRVLSAYPPNRRVREVLLKLQGLHDRPLLVWCALFLARCMPNPLYDAWGYGAGLARIPFRLYLTASALGGSIPLAFLCWFGDAAQR